ncbi:MAG: tRNA lysidine(34) synthetase TilS [Chitinophagales bacterium]
MFSLLEKYKTVLLSSPAVMLISATQGFLKQSRISLQRKRVLLACSGGLDSMVMLEVFRQLGVSVGVAHVHFGLRGADADADAALVQRTAEQHGLPFYSERFNTKAIAEARKEGIQATARELRYTWLEKIRIEHGYHYIATAHHRDDNIETVVMNFIRGTGIRGLKGMLPRQQRLIRPLLFATRKELSAFQQQHQVAFREDRSNQETYYTRNKIRLELLPKIREINPGFDETLSAQFPVMRMLAGLYERHIQKETRGLFLTRVKEVFIPLLRLKKVADQRSVLFEFLKDFGYNIAQVDAILKSTEKQSGKQFLSGQARLIKDRRFLVLAPLEAAAASVYTIDEIPCTLQLPNGRLELAWADADNTTIRKESCYAYLDQRQVQLPLTLRHWQKGDYFYPFGMERKKKKLSKYFKDVKKRLDEKEQQWVLTSEERILWVVNERNDDRARITPSTTTILRCTWHDRATE